MLAIQANEDLEPRIIEIIDGKAVELSREKWILILGSVGMVGRAIVPIRVADSDDD